MPNILIISEDRPKEVLSALKKSDVQMFESDMEGYLNTITAGSIDCAVLCVKENVEAAGTVIRNIKGHDDDLPVVVIGAGSLEDAVALMKGGASDCLRFPVNAERLQIAVSNGIRMYQLKKRVYLLENQAGCRDSFDNMIGRSPQMQSVFQLISTVAKSNATVLILGESGTGKELVAKAIAHHSPRATQPFIDINCGAIPRELLENELFGHERGAYTGADKRYIGSCERAHKGTLFLDEICEMDPSLQVKILRLLQERTFTRVGGSELLMADIRFIAATNRNIQDEVKKGNFREDLYYRLNVVPIIIPPLRERPQDVPLLAKHFLEKFCAKNEKMFVDIEPDAVECLMSHTWPGNVRELENVIERVVVLHNESSVKVRHLPAALQNLAAVSSAPKASAFRFDDGQKILPLDQIEKYAIEAALAKCMGNVSKASQQLKVGQATLYRKIKQFGLKA